ncbi:hypothetical protein ACFIQG_21470 [Comamonas odontotermitis]|uniref:hypothetical protein n=1 Tax=Comamonas odontotermitis TaxID=379895 RepID=UPI00366FDD09
MTKDEIMERMIDPGLGIPRPRDVGEYFAAWLSTVYEQLTPEQQATAITVGGVVNDRSTYLIPVLKPHGIDAWLSRGVRKSASPTGSDGSAL